MRVCYLSNFSAFRKKLLILIAEKKEMSNGYYELNGELDSMFKRLESDQKMIMGLKAQGEKLIVS